MKYVKDRLGFLSAAEFERLQGEMSMTTEPKEALLKNDYLGTYLTLLKDADKEDQIPKLEECSYKDYTKFCINFQIEVHRKFQSG